uniref:Uncharacterized protein n=1 Tax=Ditylenchus dipsaci TaxID=166011 RepID=A0A915DM86_9BILA
MSTDQPVDSQHQNGVQNNSAKEVQVGTTDASTTISSTNSSCIAASNEAQRQQQTSSNNHSSGAGMLPPFSGGQRQPGSVRAKANAMESFPSTTANTPQSPITSNLFGNAIFTLGGGPSGTTNTQLAAYSIMMGNNGSSSSANSPTNSQQQILSNAANQRSSRPTSFVEHGFHTAATPWSTNSGLEFLQGISATPPPMSGPTPVLFQQQPAKNFSQQPPPSLRMSSSTHPSGLRPAQQYDKGNTTCSHSNSSSIKSPTNGEWHHFMPPPSAPLDWSMPPPQFFPPPNSRSQHMPSAYAAVPPPAAQPTINMFSTPPPPFPHQPVPTMNGMAATNGSAFGRNFVRPAAATQPPLYYSSNGAVEQQKRQPLIFNNKSQHNQLQSTSPEGNQQRNNSQDGSKKSPNSANCGAEIVNASSTANPNSGYGLFK